MYRIENKLLREDDIYNLYEKLDWIRHIHKTKEDLLKIMAGSFYVVYIYDDELLVGTGRMISDGHLTTLICGVGVDPAYQGQGIGKMIIEDLVAFGQSKNLFIELTCKASLEGYYNKLNFNQYGIAMK